MKKLKELRSFICERISGFSRSPEKIVTYVEDGKIEYWRSAGLGHRYAYSVNILLTDFSGDIDEVVLNIIMWMKKYEPWVDNENYISIDADIIDDERSDILIKVKLTESVKVIEGDGGYNVEHMMPEFFDEEEGKRFSLKIKDEVSGDEWNR